MTEMKTETSVPHLPHPLGKAPTYYDTLNVGVNASRLEIREAYLRMKSTYGPGSDALYSLLSEEDAREAMEKVEEAFRVLNDDIERAKYNDEQGISVDSPAETLLAVPRAEVQKERIVHARKVEAGYDHDLGDGFVKTMRSTLPIIKTRASNVSKDSIQNTYQDIIEECDPGDGDLYRRLREAAGVTVEEIQERTKVSIGYIQGLESNQFDRLPQLIYVKGFLRSYLRYLNVPDGEALVTAFAKRLADWQENQKK